MRIIVISLLSLAALFSADDARYKTEAEYKEWVRSNTPPTPVSVDLYAFGASYHSNRKVDYNELNPGLGIGLTWYKSSGMEPFVATGTYHDSYGEDALFAMGGFRRRFGNIQETHGSVGVAMGYFDGSGKKGIVGMPILSIGYNRFELCVTGSYRDNEYNEDIKKSNTSVIATFLRIRLKEF